MAQTQCLALSGVAEMEPSADFAHHPGLFQFAAPLEKTFELGGRIKMVFYCIFAPTGNEYDVLDSGRYAFFDGVLNQRLVHDGEHFFRHRFRGWEESGSQACYW